MKLKTPIPLSIKAKYFLKLLVKILFTIIALYVISLKVNLDELKAILFKKFSIYLVLGFVFFNLSQMLSVKRFQDILKAVDIKLSYVFNLKFYYKAMFYNLFLPGGIGGDGYKYFYLKKEYDIKSKTLIAHLLADRVFGMVAILLLILLLSFVVLNEYFDYKIYILLGFTGLTGLFVFYKLVNKWTRLGHLTTNLLGYSLVIQCIQLMTVMCIMFHFDMNHSFYIYLFLFLISSIVSILPVSFGGLGAREAVFIFSADYFKIDSNLAVALPLMFFIITALSSLIGNFVKVKSLKSS